MASEFLQSTMKSDFCILLDDRIKEQKTNICYLTFVKLEDIKKHLSKMNLFKYFYVRT